jgi:hypothetical protein
VFGDVRQRFLDDAMNDFDVRGRRFVAPLTSTAMRVRIEKSSTSAVSAATSPDRPH